MKSRVKILLVDENGFERRAIRGFLEARADADVVAEAEDAGEALAALLDTPPDMVIVDLPYDLEAGLSLVRTIRSNNPQMPVMIIASNRERAVAEHAMDAGAAGYMLLHEIANSLPAAVYQLQHGGQYVSEELTLTPPG